ncbi:Fic family protein [Allorhizocola rhizosphaerae]|uniref:Fic family protein n=1 Tax=Allorhizocola rhizosphaerae TaxID=1872709 RepID=UPI0013C2BEEF|nr:Fic family protein [Allorhizocola rhizosphaerae]
MTTETDLRDWRLGQIIAERLCAGIMHACGFVDVDPQATLGGPDGRKDIVAFRDGRKVVAAVYFPPTPPTFAEIRAKYRHDRDGVAANHADGFVFFVNQHLTLGQRQELAGSTGADEIFHLERIRSLLDSPRGYGLRLEYLNRPMTAEEQLSLFNAQRQDVLHHLLTTQPPEVVAEEVRSSVANLNVWQLRLLHRVLMEAGGAHVKIGGQYREMQVWVSGADEVHFQPPPPHDVPRLVLDLMQWWRGAYVSVIKADQEAVIRVLARFHFGLSSIQPFLDGNGRLARVLIDQAAEELLGKRIAADLTGSYPAYHQALRAADAGDLEPLTDLIRVALEG